MKRLKLVLLYGGPSGEHEVSLRSAASVLTHLDVSQYDLMPIGMDKQGCFYLNDATYLLSHHPHSLPVKGHGAQKIESLLVDGRFAIEADVVFPVMHGPPCENGVLQGLLELAGVAYVGCNVMSSAVCMDKDVARRLAGTIEGVSSIPYYRLSHAPQDKMWCERAAIEFGFPLFVKPCCLGSSVGIHRVETMASLLSAVHDARRYDTTVLIEAYIQGREIELAVLEANAEETRPSVSVPGEIITKHPDGFYSYAAKYTECEELVLMIPATLETNQLKTLQFAAAEIFTRVGAEGLARVDFFVQDNTNRIYFNEINTLPGFTTVSMFPKLWEASGLKYSAMLNRLIRTAIERQQRRSLLVTDYTSMLKHVTA